MSCGDTGPFRFSTLAVPPHSDPALRTHEPPNRNSEAPGTPEPKPGTRNPEPGTRNPEPGTRNPEPGTRNPEPGTRNPEHGTRNPELDQPQPRHRLHVGDCAAADHLPRIRHLENARFDVFVLVLGCRV